MNKLNQVIKRVNEKEELKTNQSYFVINEKTGEIVQNWLYKTIGKKNRYYIVSNANLARNSAEGETSVIPVKDFQSNREVGLIINYYVQCPAGNEEKLVRSLYREATPEEALLNIIENIVLNHITSREAEFIDDYLSEREKLNSLLRMQVENETGLTTKIQIHLKYEENLDTFKILEKSVPIQLKEGIEEHSITFSLDSEPDQSRVVHAVMAYTDLHLLEGKLIRSIQSFFKTRVPYQVFHDGFRNGDSIKGFEKMLNKILYDEGRLPAKWKLEPCIKGGRANEFETLAVDIQRTPYQATESVIIKNELQMILQDAAKLKSSGVSNFKSWIKESLERIIEEEVFEMRYLDFLLRFNPVEDKIRERMKIDSDLIGYKVKHLISRPDMKEEVYLKPKSYEFSYSNLPTREAGLDINLGVAVTFSIPDLNKVEKWLNKNIDLESVIELSIKSELEQILHSESPETVYMRFSIVGQDKSGSLENRLSDAIKRHLQDEYHADIIGVPIIKPMDTEISAFARSLIDATQGFRVDIEPFGNRRHTSIFHGKFTITSINEKGWSRIKKMDFTIDEVKDFFVDSLNANLGALSGDEYLLYNNPNLRTQLERVANEVVNMAVVERYGVDIAIDNFRREPVENEIRKIKAINKREQIDLDTIEHILEDNVKAIKHDSLLAENDRVAQREQAEILNRKEAGYLKTMDPLADGEELDQIERIDELKKERFKRREMDREKADELLSKIQNPSSSVSGLPSPDPLLALSETRKKTKSTEASDDVETSKNDE